MSTQLKLFENKVKQVKGITFSQLSTHQKINYKANQCGFQRIPYLSLYNYFHNILHKPKTDCLSKEYHWHHKVNSGSANRIENRKKRTELF